MRSGLLLVCALVAPACATYESLMAKGDAEGRATYAAKAYRDAARAAPRGSSEAAFAAQRACLAMKGRTKAQLDSDDPSRRAEGLAAMRLCRVGGLDEHLEYARTADPADLIGPGVPFQGVAEPMLIAWRHYHVFLPPEDLTRLRAAVARRLGASTDRLHLQDTCLLLLKEGWYSEFIEPCVETLGGLLDGYDLRRGTLDFYVGICTGFAYHDKTVPDRCRTQVRNAVGRHLAARDAAGRYGELRAYCVALRELPASLSSPEIIEDCMAVAGQRRTADTSDLTEQLSALEASLRFARPGSDEVGERERLLAQHCQAAGALIGDACKAARTRLHPVLSAHIRALRAKGAYAAAEFAASLAEPRPPEARAVLADASSRFSRRADEAASESALAAWLFRRVAHHFGAPEPAPIGGLRRRGQGFEVKADTSCQGVREELLRYRRDSPAATLELSGCGFKTTGEAPSRGTPDTFRDVTVRIPQESWDHLTGTIRRWEIVEKRRERVPGKPPPGGQVYRPGWQIRGTLVVTIPTPELSDRTDVGLVKTERSPRGQFDRPLTESEERSWNWASLAGGVIEEYNEALSKFAAKNAAQSTQAGARGRRDEALGWLVRNTFLGRDEQAVATALQAEGLSAQLALRIASPK